MYPMTEPVPSSMQLANCALQAVMAADLACAELEAGQPPATQTPAVQTVPLPQTLPELLVIVRVSMTTLFWSIARIVRLVLFWILTSTYE